MSSAAVIDVVMIYLVFRRIIVMIFVSILTEILPVANVKLVMNLMILVVVLILTNVQHCLTFAKMENVLTLTGTTLVNVKSDIVYKPMKNVVCQTINACL